MGSQRLHSNVYRRFKIILAIFVLVPPGFLELAAPRPPTEAGNAYSSGFEGRQAPTMDFQTVGRTFCQCATYHWGDKDPESQDLPFHSFYCRGSLGSMIILVAYRCD